MELKRFQNTTIDRVLEKIRSGSKKVVIQSPTGSGKTLMLSNIIDRFLEENDNYCCVWLSPGAGELEEQSKSKVEGYLPSKNCLSLKELINQNNFINDKDIIFINWESVANENNIALRETEKQNLKDKIDVFRNGGGSFIVVRDECHRNKTAKADNLIEIIKPDLEINASATVDAEDKNCKDLIIISDEDVISEGLITRHIVINEGVNSCVGDIEDNEDDIENLLNKALKKRNEIEEHYQKKGINNIVPLIIIQYPNENTNNKQPSLEFSTLFDKVCKLLSDKGYSFSNGKVSCWFSENKRNIGEDNQPLDTVVVLHTKQALATGWDCPRAKILVKYRLKGNDSFEIQTLGRIRRMPEGQHYEDSVLDDCYLYTYDNNYKLEAIKQFNGKTSKIIELKDDYKNLSLPLKCHKFPKGFNKGIGEEFLLFERIKSYYSSFKGIIPLSENIDSSQLSSNQMALEKHGYNFGNKTTITITSGSISSFSEESLRSIEDKEIDREISDERVKKIYKQKFYEIASKTALKDYRLVKLFLRKLFKSNEPEHDFSGYVYRFRENSDFLRFVVINQSQIIEDFNSAQAVITNNQNQSQNTKKNDSKDRQITISDCYVFPSKMKVFYKENGSTETRSKSVYKDYTLNIEKSKPERRFEKYCEDCPEVKWVFKNEDMGEEAFSISYKDSYERFHLFFPDYLVMTTDDRLFIIETKGGENIKQESKNIDDYSETKFNALKEYVSKLNKETEKIHFAFVRDKEYLDEEQEFKNKLLFNNSEYCDDLENENWKEIGDLFTATSPSESQTTNE